MIIDTDNSLQFMTICATINAYLIYAKGGHSDSYGRLSHTRGGSTQAEIASRHHRAVATSREIARLQDSRFLACQGNRIRGLDETTQKQSSQRVEEVSRFGLSVAERTSTGWKLVNARSCVRYLVAYYSTGDGWIEEEERYERGKP